MTVYHYCSMDSFYAIVQNKTLRLTDITKSNDSKEIAWIFQYVEDVFRDVYNQEKEKYFKDRYDSIFDRMVRDSKRIFFDERLIIPYICCFSGAESRDLLSQWRGYTDDGRGVAVGVDEGILSSVKISFKKEPIKMKVIYFSKVLYDVNSQKHIVRKKGLELIKELKSIVKDKKVNDNQLVEESRLALMNCFVQLYNCATVAKNPFFEEENEYRIVYIVGRKTAASGGRKIRLENDVQLGEIAYGTFQNKLVSYCDLDFSGYKYPNKDFPSFIKEVVIGPKSLITKDDVEHFLSINGFPADKINVIYSKGTYR